MASRRPLLVSLSWRFMAMPTNTAATSAIGRLLCLAVIVLAMASPACPSGPLLELSQYAHNSWTTRDGFLKGGVRSIAQTADGYLWLGTEFGLVRFDGVQFRSWTPPAGQHLPSTNIRSLVAARDGTLWIGTLEGLASWKDGKLNQYPELSKQNVLSLLEDNEGTIWAGTFRVPKGQLCAIQHATVNCYGADGVFGEWVWSLYEDGDGRLWAGAETGLWRWKPGPPKRYPMQRPVNTSQAIAQIAQHAGLLAIGESIWQLVDEKMKEYPLATLPGRLTTPVNLFRDDQGGLWVGTLQRGLMRVDQGKTSRFAETEGLSSDHILTLFEDHEKNIWVGTENGVDRFHEPPVPSISTKQGLSSPSIWTVLVARDNSAWLSTLDGLNRWKAGAVTVYRSGTRENIRARRIQGAVPPRPEQVVTEKNDPGLPDDRVGSLYEDENGRIWVSTPGGIARFEHGRFVTVKEVPGGWVNAITGDNHGGVYISYEDKGLVHWEKGKFVGHVPWSKLGGDVVASSLLPDPARDALWLGFFQGGLVYFKDGEVRAHYGTSDGLGAGRVMGLELGPDGVLWAATEGGLSRLKDGRITTLTTANGLPCDTVHWSMQVDDSFWLYTACGLLQVRRAEMDKWSADPRTKIQFALFDSSDGVRSRALLTGYTPHVSKSPDGKLWFAHFDAVSVLDPRDLRLNPLPPPVHIEQIMADGKVYAAVANLRLPARIRDLGIDYTGLSLAAPEKMQFRVKLDGQDKDWRVPANPRHSHYTNLPPGKYTFRVKACNNSGVWNEAGALLDFSISPAYYQTNWFRALCALFLIALAWAGYRLRVRHLHREFDMTLDARVGERTRIARELHDTLLQSFHGLLLRFQAVSQLLPERPVDAKTKLDEAIKQAASAVTEGRDAVQGLRTSTLEANDLALAISTLGEELAADSNNHRCGFRVAVEGETRDLHPIIRDEIYKLAAEALRNAFRHACAKQVEAEIRYDDEQFRLRIRDDGTGIDSAVLSRDGSEGHYGLRGMRERAKLIGGKLTVWSEVDAGTELELYIPASKAYMTPRRSSWFSRRFTAKA